MCVHQALVLGLIYKVLVLRREVPINSLCKQCLEFVQKNIKNLSRTLVGTYVPKPE